MIVANCVLSPSSAKKIVPKVVRKIFQSIIFLLKSHFVPSMQLGLAGKTSKEKGPL
jgi:hypothetical protein